MTYRAQIIAPGYISNDFIELLPQSIAMLQKQGISVVQDDVNIFQDGHLFYANSLDSRLASLRNAILSQDADIIWCFKGGYGSGELVSKCLDIKPRNRKTLIGYSDITILHGLFNWKYNMPSIHGPMLESIAKNGEHDLCEVKRILDGGISIVKLMPMTQIAQKISINSIVTGGNLSSLVTMIGTNIHPETSNKILLLEDVDEDGYRIARMLNHLVEAGVIYKVSAIIFGSFTNSCKYLNQVIDAFIQKHCHIPIYKTDEIGHGLCNIPVVFGTNAVLHDCELHTKICT